MSEQRRRLEEDLEAGRVDATTYRQRRDALLTAEAAPDAPAAGPAVTAPPASPDPVGEAVPSADPAAGPDPVAEPDPDPEPPALEPPTAGAPPVPELAARGGASVAGPATEWIPAVPPASSERTQAVPTSPAARVRSSPTPPPLSAPPWAGSTPAGTQRRPGNAPSRMLGPEVFARPAPSPVVAVLGTALVVALALAVIVGSFLL